MSIGVTEIGGRPHKPIARVLMTSDASGRGFCYTLDLMRALSGRGVGVVLVSLGKRLSQEQHRALWAIPALSVYEEHVRGEEADHAVDDLRRVGALLLELEQRYRPDVIHLCSGAHAVASLRAPLVVHAQQCALAYHRALHDGPPPSHLERYRERVFAGMKRADAVVAFSESGLCELEEHYGPLQDRRVLAPGCDPEAFVPDLKEEIIFSAGRLWDPGRNLAALARIEARTRWPVYVADDGQRSPAALHTIDLPRRRGLHYLGRLSRAQFANWLGRAAIFVQPGRYEPSGLSVLEAAFSGCALVLADIPSLRERWEDVAVFVRPDDDEQLHAALETLSKERSSREALAQAARERAFSFTLRRAADQSVALYQELIARRAAREPQACARTSMLGGKESALL